MTQFTATILLLLAFVQFGHAQLVITAQPQTTSCNDSILLTASVTGQLGTTSYLYDSIPYAPESYAGTTVPLADDELSGALPIGFTFCFLNASYTQFYVCSNGFITFDANNLAQYIAVPIPSQATDVPKSAILGPWGDWNPNLGGRIKYQTVGTMPNRRLVVSWDSVGMYQCPTQFGSFQIVIHETTGLIENHMREKPACTAWINGVSTQGVHNGDGTVAFFNPAHNGTTWTASNESCQFTPNGITWKKDGNIIGEGATYMVHGDSSGTYTAEVLICGTAVYQHTIDIPDINGDVTLGAQLPHCVGDSTGLVYIDFSGTGNYMHVWTDQGATTTDTLSDLTAGTYSVVVTNTDLNCFDTFDISFTDPAQIAFTNSTTSACSGTANGTITIDSVWNGNAPYTYCIDNGAVCDTINTFINVSPGTHQLVVIDSLGCSDTTTAFVINVPLASNASMYPTDDTFYIPHSPIVLWSSASYPGSWSGPGVSAGTFDPDIAGIGEHWLYFTYSDPPCAGFVDSILLVCIDLLSVQDHLSNSSITVFPNPLSDHTVVQFNPPLQGNHSIQVFDVLGKKIYSAHRITGARLIINSSQWESGMYLLNITNNATREVEYSVKLIAE